MWSDDIKISWLSIFFLSSLLYTETPPPSNVWKSHVHKFLALKTHMDLVEECDAYHLSSCSRSFYIKPVSHWAVTVGDINMTRMNNFSIHLLVGCDGLEKDASRFRTRNTGGRIQDPSCKLYVVMWLRMLLTLSVIAVRWLRCEQPYFWQPHPLSPPCFLTPLRVQRCSQGSCFCVSFLD